MSVLVGLPVLVPLAVAVAMLGLTAWPRLQRGAALGAGGILFALAVTLFLEVRAEGIGVHALAGWPAPYGIVLVADLLSATLVAVSSGIFLAGLVYSTAYVDSQSLRSPYLPLYFFLMTGVNGAFLTGDVFNLFVFFELMLLSTYGLVIVRDPDGLVPRAEKLEAVFKYLVLNLIGAALMLLAIGTLYGTTGTLNMADLSVKVAALRTAGVVHLEAIALLFVAVFGLKAAAAPFHFWLPDVHPSAPTPVSALLSGILIKVGAYGLLRLTTLLFPGFQAVSEIVLILGLGTVLVGAVLATGQQDVKRLLAYSSVSQMGFILIAVGLGGARGIAAALFFLINHAIIKSMLFLAAGWAMQLTHERSLNRMGGLQGASPGLAAAFLVGAMALAGLPPTNGFVSKVLVFQVLLDSGRAIYLAVGMFGAVLGIVYAFRAWIKLFWGDRKGPTDAPPPQVAIRAPVAILAALCVVLGIASAPLVDLVTLIGVELADPSIYVDAVLGGSGP